MPGTLSAKNRKEIIEKITQSTYDLLIIGGGITGAGIALDAASRGLKVALIEKSDFASGTSSKSTKLIHGGLRYLKQLEFKIVHEVGQERAIVHRLAPHLVTSEKMLLPLIEGGTYGPFATSIGLWVYDFLAGVKGDDRRIMFNKKKTIQKEPLLRNDNLLGGGYYAEYRTDDARLTMENIKTAVQHGATVLNHAAATDFIFENGQVKGSKVQCQLSGQEFNIQASFVVSAAGPWVDKLRKVQASHKGKRLFLSKGVHIVVPHERLPIQQSVYFDVDDGRMIFAIPRQRITYIGTTDTAYEGDLDNIPIFREDVEYLLDAANSMFPQAQLKLDDIESSWAGLRPLIYEEGKSASEMSRKDEVFISDNGLISIAGGKLTGYRKMAEKVTNLVIKRFVKANGQAFKKNHTDKIPLTGGPFKNATEVNQYQKSLGQKLLEKGLGAEEAIYLIANYGKQSEVILSYLQDFLQKNEPETALVRAELRYALEEELACTALDFFDRRTGRLYFNQPSIPKVMDIVLKDMQENLHWDSERVKQERTNLETELFRLRNFERQVS